MPRSAVATDKAPPPRETGRGRSRGGDDCWNGGDASGKGLGEPLYLVRSRYKVGGAFEGAQFEALLRFSIQDK